jgi:D-sedoheptulose 7-phosphate isomerase
MKQFVNNYFKEFQKLTACNLEISDRLQTLKALFESTHKSGNKIIFVGNGGSAAMASHCAVDLSKNAGIRSINFNEADLITCLANDRGFENWVTEALKLYADKGDVVVLISSSGKSDNMINAAKYCNQNFLTLVTVTGMDKRNPLKSQNDKGAYTDSDLNLWVNSRAYNLIEMVHHFWLLCICDMIIGKAEYSA